MNGVQYLRYSAGSWSTHHAYHADSVGNISALVSTAQAVSASYRYDPFGRTIALSGTMAGQNTYRFSSKMFVSPGDLYYYGYRFYDPNYQRWLNQDPIEEDGGINLYGFVENDPLSGVDLEGLQRFNIRKPNQKPTSPSLGQPKTKPSPQKPDRPLLKPGPYAPLQDNAQEPKLDSHFRKMLRTKMKKTEENMGAIRVEPINSELQAASR
jgi:RHS repeat-associated protein